MDFLIDIGITIALDLIVFVCLLLIVAYSTWFERKLLGDFQLRYGPMRVGFHGLMQPIADAIKSFFKEDVIPKNADTIVFILAPMLSFVCALGVIAVIPFGGTVHIFGREVNLVLSNIDVSVLYIFALAALGSYGCVLGGYASYNKYSLVGALRASALMISYELPFALTIIAVVLVSGTLSFNGIVDAQTGLWNIVKQPVGFILAIICGLAEINRTPFDMPETESELACGFNVEYSSMKFSMFFMAEYCHLFTISAIITTLYLGGWHGPFLPGPIWFLIKSVALMYFFIWERSTYPRLRIDQIMRFGWKFLLPVSLANLVITAIVLAFLN